MRIREIDIDGFGVFAAHVLRDLGPGLNVLLGDNEAGKSTLLAFIRTILFGFPDGRSRDNPYPPLRGGSHGGRLLLERAAGAQYQVERRPGVRGGAVTVTGADGSGGAEALRELLGPLTRDLFRNVYAFSLSELQSFDTLQDDAVRAALYGASAGASILALPRVQGDLERRLGDLYKPQGINPLLNQRFREFERVDEQLHTAVGMLDRYNAVTAAIGGIDTRAAAVRSDRRAVNVALNEQETLLRLWPTWLQLIDAEQRIAELPPLELPFPEAGVSRIESLCAVRAAHREQQVRAEGAHARAVSALKDVMVDERLLAAGEAIDMLHGRVGTRPEHAQRLQDLRGELAEATDRLAVVFSELGADWNESRLRRIDRSLFSREAIQHHREAISTAHDAVQQSASAVAALEQSHAVLARELVARQAHVAGLLDPGPGPAPAAVETLRTSGDRAKGIDRELSDLQARIDSGRANLQRIMGDLGPDWSEEGIGSVDLSVAGQSQLDEIEGRIEQAQVQLLNCQWSLANYDAQIRSEQDALEVAQRAQEAAPAPGPDTRETLEARQATLRTLRSLLQHRREAISELEGQRHRATELEERIDQAASERAQAEASLSLAEGRAQMAERTYADALTSLEQAPVLEGDSAVELDARQASLREQRRLLAEVLDAEQQLGIRRDRLRDLGRTIGGIASAAPPPAQRGLLVAATVLVSGALMSYAAIAAVDRGLLTLPPSVPPELRGYVLVLAPVLVVVALMLAAAQRSAARRLTVARAQYERMVEELEGERAGVLSDAEQIEQRQMHFVAELRRAARGRAVPSRLQEIDECSAEIQRSLDLLLKHAALTTAVQTASRQLEEARTILSPLRTRVSEAIRTSARLRAILGSQHPCGNEPDEDAGSLPTAVPLRDEMVRLEGEAAHLTRDLERTAAAAGLTPPARIEDIETWEGEVHDALARLGQHAVLSVTVDNANSRCEAARTLHVELTAKVAAAQQHLDGLRAEWDARVGAMGLPAGAVSKHLRSFLIPAIRSASEHLARLHSDEERRTSLTLELCELEREIAPLLTLNPTGSSTAAVVIAIDRQLAAWEKGAKSRAERDAAVSSLAEDVRREGESAAALDAARGQLAAKRACEVDAHAAWQAWLHANLLPEDLSPHTAFDALQCVTQGIEASAAIDRVAKQVKELEDEARECRERCAVARGDIGWPPLGNEPVSDAVAQLARRLTEAREAALRRTQLEDTERSARSELETANDLLAATTLEIEQLVNQAGATDEEDFRHRGRVEAERVELMSAVQQSERTLVEGSGRPDLGALKAQLATLRSDDITQAVADLKQRAEGLESALNDLHAERALRVVEKEQLASSDDIAELRARQEQLRTEIASLGREWSRHAIAQHLLEEAKQRFEREHQPRVLKDASEFLALMTGGRYREVKATLEQGGGLEVITKDSTPCAPAVLSRGTQEQLYLALRFGYIVNHQTGNEAMPVVMDEVLVNFDPARAMLAAQAIRHFATRRQILFFTCHPWVADLLKGDDPAVPVWHLTDGCARASSDSSTPSSPLKTSPAPGSVW